LKISFTGCFMPRPESVKVLSQHCLVATKGDRVMRAFAYYLLLSSLAAGGPADASFAGGDNTAGVASGAVTEDSCAVFENGMVPELFGIDAALVSYRRSVPVKRAGHVVCIASWDNPGKAEMEAAYAQKLQEWSRNMATGKKEPMPKSPSAVAQVSVTLMATRFDSDAAAVASLEEAVASLSKGVTVNVAGKDHEKKTEFGEWLDNVGDKAIFSDGGELLVASGGKRFSVTVSVSDDVAADRELAVELVGRLEESM